MGSQQYAKHLVSYVGIQNKTHTRHDLSYDLVGKAKTYILEVPITKCHITKCTSSRYTFDTPWREARQNGAEM